MELKFFLKECTFFVLYVLDQLFSQVFVKGFRLCLQNNFKRVERTLLTIFFPKVLLLQFCLTFSRNAFDFSKKCPSQNCIFACPFEEIIENFFLWKSQFQKCCRTFIRKSWGIRQKFWAWLSKLPSMCLEEFFGGSFFDIKSTLNFFSYFDRKIIRLLTTIFSQFCPSTLQGVQRNYLRMGFKKIFWVRYLFKLWANIFGFFP